MGDGSAVFLCSAVEVSTRFLRITTLVEAGLTMRNVTITLPEDVARWLRVRAAEADRSVSGWIAELLRRMRREEDEYEAAMRSALARQPIEFAWPEGRRPTRDELYGRPVLR